MAEQNKKPMMEDGDKMPEKTPEEKKKQGEYDMDDNKLSEQFLSLFDGLNLSEDFKTRASAIFTAAVDEMAQAKIEEAERNLQESFDQRLEDEVQTISENVDKYVTHAARTFLDENKLAIQSSAQVQAAQDIVESAKSVFVGHSIDIPEDDVDALKESEQKLADKAKELDEAMDREIALKVKIQEHERADVVREISEGLVLTQAERLGKLAESVEFTSTENFKVAVSALKESVVLGAKIVVGEPAKQNLDEGKVVTVPLDEKVEEPVAQKPRRRF